MMHVAPATGDDVCWWWWLTKYITVSLASRILYVLLHLASLSKEWYIHNRGCHSNSKNWFLGGGGCLMIKYTGSTLPGVLKSGRCSIKTKNTPTGLRRVDIELMFSLTEISRTKESKFQWIVSYSRSRWKQFEGERGNIWNSLPRRGVQARILSIFRLEPGRFLDVKVIKGCGISAEIGTHINDLKGQMLLLFLMSLCS